MTALTTACNEALSRVMKGPISDLSEESLEAQYCQMFAQPLLDEIADWCVWPDLIKRTNLALVANDRQAEWLYAYAEPSDFGEPIAIRKVEDAEDFLPEIALPYTLPNQDRNPLGFIIEGGKVYTNVKDAALVYSNKEMTANDLTPIMRKAFVSELAVRLAYSPVGKLSANKISRLEENAARDKLDAISDAQNKNERMMPNFKTQAEFAREGFLE